MGYPGKAFPDSEEGKKSKAYVQRFLDATRSDMLFAQKVIFVEGLAEQLLLPTLAKYVNQNLEDHHIAIIPVGGRFFSHFLYLFDTNNAYSVPKKVICIKDRDPERKKKSGGSYSTCFPFQIGQDTATYDYKDHISGKVTTYQAHPNIRYFGQNHGKGKTFEYELCLCNPDEPFLITDSITNRDELLALYDLRKNKKPLADFITELRMSDANQRLEDAINDLSDPAWTDNDKQLAILASRYLASVGKGENALELANLLEANILLPQIAPDNDPQVPIRKSFTVPGYIKDAIDWICN